MRIFLSGLFFLRPKFDTRIKIDVGYVNRKYIYKTVMIGLGQSTLVFQRNFNLGASSNPIGFLVRYTKYLIR